MSTKDLVYIPDHKDRAIDPLLLQQFRDKPRWNALLRGLAAGVQLEEDELFGLCNDMQLINARGDQLDNWGTIVGEQRGAMADDDYRRFITARILVNISGGTVDELIAIWELITAPSLSVRLFQAFPASYTLQVVRDEFLTDAVARRVTRMMADAKPLGIAGTLVEAVSGYFGFELDADALGYDVGVYSRILS